METPNQKITRKTQV